MERFPVPRLALGLALGSLAFGLNAEQLQEAPTIVNRPQLSNIRQAFNRISDRVLGPLMAPESASAAGTPWPVIGGVPTLPKILVDYTYTPDGYWEGNLTGNDTAEVSGINRTITVTRGTHRFSENWSWIRTLHADRPTDTDCGWIRTFQLSRVHTVSKPNICKDLIKYQAYRDHNGAHYNGPPHALIGGTFYTGRKPECQFVPLNRNFDQHVKPPVNYGPVPPVPLTNGEHFRFLNKPDLASATSGATLKVANTKTPGWHHYKMWGVDYRRCLKGKLTGGPKKPGL